MSGASSIQVVQQPQFSVEVASNMPHGVLIETSAATAIEVAFGAMGPRGRPGDPGLEGPAGPMPDTSAIALDGGYF